MIRRVLSGLAILVLIVMAALLGSRRSVQEMAGSAAPPREEPGYAARDAELVETGDDGRPLYTVDADLIRQQPGQGIVTLETVRVDYRGEARSQWALSAERGLIRESTDAIELDGNVHVVALLPGMSDLAQIYTSRLLFDPHTEIARTDAPVRLLWTGREVEATGLTANLKDQRLRLESAVHGLFTP